MRSVGRKLGRGKGVWLAGAAALACLAPGATLAQSVWNGAGTGWATGGNWTPTGVPGGATSVVIQASGGASNPIISTGGNAAASVSVTGRPLTLSGAGALTIGGGTGTLTLGPGGSLVLEAGTAYGALLLGPVVNNGTFQADEDIIVGALSGAGSVTVAAGKTFTTQSTTSSTFSGSITGAGSFEKQDVSTLTLTGTSNIGGDLIDCCGTIAVSGTGRFTVGGSIAVLDTFDVLAGGQVTSVGVLASDNSGTTVSGAGSQLTVGGVLLGLTNGAGLRAINGGTFVSDASVSLAAASSESGFIVDGAGSTATVDGAVSLFSGQNHHVDLTNGGSLTITGDVLSLAGGGTRLKIGDGAGAGTLTAVDVEGAGTVAFNHTGTTTFATPIIDTVRVTKAGAGTAILTGTSTSTGTMTVNAGTLRVDGAWGAGAVTVNSGAALGGSGSIGGQVTVAAGGILAPGNSAGTLAIGGNLILANTSQLNFELATAGVVGSGVNDLITVGGALTLDGVLNVTNLGNMGAGVYRLITYSGALTNNVLTVGSLPAGLAPGEAAVQTATANQVNLLVTGNPTPIVPPGSGGGGGDAPSLGNTLVWDGAGAAADGRIQGGDGTWGTGGTSWTTVNGAANGAFTPGGMAIFQGAPGVVTVAGSPSAGAMQFAVGGYRLTGGNIVLAAAQTPIRVGDGTPAGTAMTATIEASLTGAGGLVKRDAGTLTLAGANTFTGGTVVEGGILRVDGSVGAVTVLSGGSLQGRGRIGGLTLGGVINPGNSIGTLTVAGPFVQQAGSTYRVEIDPTGASDRIAVQGPAAIQGGVTVAVSAASGFYAAGTSYSILTATGGVTGTYAVLTQDLPFLDLALAYTPGSVLLNVTRNGTALADVARTANQRAVAAGAGGPVTAALASLSQADARAAFDALSGEIHASAKGALIEGGRYLREAIAARTTGGMGLVTLSPAPKAIYWAQAFGAWGGTDGDGNAAKLDHDVRGVFLGGDVRLSDGWRAGLATGLSRDDLDLSARAASADVSSYHLAAYASGRFGAWSVDLGAGYSWDSVETRRRAAFTGFTDAASADYAANTAQVFAEVRHAWRGLNPFAGLAHVRVDVDGFRERGGVAALAGAGHDDGATFATLGLRPALAARRGDLRGTVAWRRLLGDVTPSQPLGFLAGGTAFTATAAPLGRDALVLEGQASVQVWPGARAAIGYSGQLSDETWDHSLKASFTAAF